MILYSLFFLFVKSLSAVVRRAVREPFRRLLCDQHLILQIGVSFLQLSTTRSTERPLEPLLHRLDGAGLPCFMPGASMTGNGEGPFQSLTILSDESIRLRLRASLHSSTMREVIMIHGRQGGAVRPVPPGHSTLSARPTRT
jgi:hypothetical protein